MTTIETGPTWSERMDPRNWPLAWKLVAVGLIPALLALVLGVLQVAGEAERASDLGRSTRLLEIEQRVADAADALRRERHSAALFVAGNRTGDGGAVQAGFGQTDGEVDTMLGSVRSASDLDVTTRSALQKAERELSRLARVRTDVANNPEVNADEIIKGYTFAVGSVDDLGSALLRQLTTPGIGGLPDALTAVKSISEQLSVQHTTLGVVLTTGSMRIEDADTVRSTENQLTGAVREYQSALTLGIVAHPVDATANTRRIKYTEDMLRVPLNRAVPMPVNIAEWDSAYEDARTAAIRSADRIRDGLTRSSTAAEEQASNEAGLNSVILMLGLLLGVATAIIVARSLLRSLRLLRSSALDVAERRLPQAVESMRAGKSPDVVVEPVPLTGRDEIGQVARAFDAVHGQAVHLAAEQAALQANVSAMFVNLSRRSQALVERQLQLIEQLESNEQDPDQLSNLFQLDHLATRMRRNSENLLVLAGTDHAKRNIAPVPLVDVLRAAVSEVDQYQRIIVQAPPTATILGRAASDLVHLLAELLDNATNFSPPDSQVVMSTARASDGSIIVEIADRGVGMPEHEVSDANERLRGPSTVNVSASRRMGLFVVGRLAARHAIDVQLSTSAQGDPGAGLTALVTVPAQLIPSSETDGSRTYISPQQATGQNMLPSRPEALPQRGMNGSNHSGSLSALIAGTDGPANPAGTFDAPSGQDSHLFTAPPQVNGTPNGGLPNRRPGATIRPDGPPLPPARRDTPDPGVPEDPAANERAAAERAREVAEQARRDQEAAAARAAAKAAEQQQQQQHYQQQQQQAYRNGAFPPVGANGSTTEATGPRHEDPSGERRPDVRRPSAEDSGPVRSEQGRSADDRVTGQEQVSPPRTVEEETGRFTAAPPTMPFSEVRHAPNAPQERRPFQEPRQQAPSAQSSGYMSPVESQPPAGGDELFAPQMPVIAEPGRPGDAGSARATAAFERGETTPIFEEIASAWFRSNRPIPVAWQSDQDGNAPSEQAQQQQPAPQPAPRPAPRQAAPPTRPTPQMAPQQQAQRPVQQPAPQPVAQAPQQEFANAADDGRRTMGNRPDGSDPSTSAGLPRRAVPVEAAAEPVRQPVAATPDQEFASAADEGWRAVSGVLSADAPDETTAAGLPKRRPRARLVPGSAGSAVMASPIASTRNAETIRGRLASYQSGVRQGREFRSRGDQGSTPEDLWGSGTESAGNAGNNHDEEST